MRISKSFIALLGTMGLLLTTYSCKEWGDSDAPAGNQVYPAREPLGSITFKGLSSIEEASFILSKTGDAAIAFDNTLYTEVVELHSGTITMANPLVKSKLQTGAGVSLWAKNDGSADGSLISFVGDDGSKVSFSTDGILTSTTPTNRVMVATPGGRAEGEEAADALLPADEWRFLAIQINADGCLVYSDGTLVASVSYEKDTALVSVLNKASHIVIGDESLGSLCVDRISFTRNSMIASDVKRPNITRVVTLPDPVYFTDFSSTAGLTIVGAGQFTTDANEKFGAIFQNKASAAPRQNYLLMPDHILSHSAETKQMTIGFWVNASNAGTSASYMWAPLFMAYGAAPVNGENTWPMFACQYRGVLQLNCAGWTDYTNEQNVAGENKLYHNDTDWLADHQWHYYTVVFNEENAKVYFDGEIANEWQMDGVGNTQMGLFTNGGDLKYICLGGNQAWGWADNDPGFAFDDFVVYDQALSDEQIQKIITDKSNGGGGAVIPADIPEPYYRNTFESAEEQGLTIVGAGEFVSKSDKHGMVFQNATSAAPRQNYLLLPEDLLSHSAETKQLTVSFWVNASNAGESPEYMWAPLFMAYGAAPVNGENTWPMLACQYRGVLQLNCAGWTDFKDEQNTAGVNGVYHNETDWLADKEWHYYTVVFDNENAKVYFDGVLKNEWNCNGTDNTQMGLFTNGGDLKYICLGGNQAWNWADNDPGFAFDDITCFNVALTAAQIKALMSVYQ